MKHRPQGTPMGCPTAAARGNSPERTVRSVDGVEAVVSDLTVGCYGGRRHQGSGDLAASHGQDTTW